MAAQPAHAARAARTRAAGTGRCRLEHQRGAADQELPRPRRAAERGNQPCPTPSTAARDAAARPGTPDRPRTAQLHAAPAAVPGGGAVIEGPVAVIRAACLQPAPRAVGPGIRGDQEDARQRRARARPSRGQPDLAVRTDVEPAATSAAIRPRHRTASAGCAWSRASGALRAALPAAQSPGADRRAGPQGSTRVTGSRNQYRRRQPAVQRGRAVQLFGSLLDVQRVDERLHRWPRHAPVARPIRRPDCVAESGWPMDPPAGRTALNSNLVAEVRDPWLGGVTSKTRMLVTRKETLVVQQAAVQQAAVQQAAVRQAPRAQSGRVGVHRGAEQRGAHHAGQELTPDVLRAAGLLRRLAEAGVAVTDTGTYPARCSGGGLRSPRKAELDAVVGVAREVADAVAAQLAAGRRVLVAGGDCTITLGVIAGVPAPRPGRRPCLRGRGR